MGIFKKLSVLTMLFALMIFFTPINAKAATIGDQLPTKEAGWQRIDDADTNIIYEGIWSTLDNTSFYNKKLHYTNDTSNYQFKFYGTKFRLILPTNNGHTSEVSVKVDDIEYSYSEYSSSLKYNVIAFEKLGLNLGYHTVIVTNRQSNKNMDIDAIDIDDNGYLVPYYQPTNLLATPGNTYVTLKWDQIPDASGYIIRYGITSENLTETKTVTEGAITTTDIEGLLNRTKYYFTVTAIINGVENTPSIEVTATPVDDSLPTDHVGNTATLELTMTNGGIKVYNLPIADLDNFLTWYDNRSNGEGRAYYTFTKTTNIAPYLSVKEYVSFDKISSFEVKEYNQ